MLNNLINGLKTETKLTYTENGHLAYRELSSPLLTLFGVIGALRSRLSDVDKMFEEAFDEDNLLATRMMFYARDVRGGLGEREVFRRMLNWVATNHPEALEDDSVLYGKLRLIPEFGRWDDMFSLLGTSLEVKMFDFIRNQLGTDYANLSSDNSISLLAKWMPSENASSKYTKKLALYTAKKIGLSPKKYRKMLSALRSKIDVVETKMSGDKWTEINYSAVPSKAHRNYTNAFERHDTNGYEEYKEKLETGEAKINAGAVYPYEILEAMGLDYVEVGRETYTLNLAKYNPVLEAQWKSLPNYVEGENNVLVMADTSGSMEGRPLATSVGLAIYLAERNTGVWKNKFMTFDELPTLVDIGEGTLSDKLSRIEVIVANTNLELAVMRILDTAVKYNVPKSDFPNSFIVISDMEIDGIMGDTSTFHDKVSAKYAEAGYEIPHVVYWNVNSRQNVFHATEQAKGVSFVSGQSPSVFKQVLNAVGKSAYQLMLETLNSDRYSVIK